MSRLHLARSDAFEAFANAKERTAALWLSVLGLFVYPAFGLVDYVMWPDQVWTFVKWRLGVSGLLLVLGVANHSAKRGLRTRQRMSGFVVLVAGATIAAMTHRTGGIASPYYVGMIPVMIGSIFFSWPLWLGVTVFGSMFVAYLGPIAWTDGLGFSPALVGNLAFLGSSGLLALLCQAMYRGLVERDFVASLQLSEAHDRLKRLQAVREQMLRNLSGELQMPLADLSLWIERMRTDHSHASSAGAQAALLKEARDTAHEVRMAAANAQRTASEAIQANEEICETIRRGGATLSGSLSGLDAVHDEVVQMAQRMGSVGSRAEEVETVVETIEDVADQIRLLSLNASLEAVRAGEAGKAFEAVAREVRKLSDLAVAGTDKTRQVLRALRHGMTEATHTSSQGAARVGGLLTAMRANGEQLERLVALTTQMNASVRQVASAAEQQSRGLERVLDSLDAVTAGGQETLRLLADSERAVASVRSLAFEVSKLVTATAEPEAPAAQSG